MAVRAAFRAPLTCATAMLAGQHVQWEMHGSLHILGLHWSVRLAVPSGPRDGEYTQPLPLLSRKENVAPLRNLHARSCEQEA